jgi:hypothetical protein
LLGGGGPTGGDPLERSSAETQERKKVGGNSMKKVFLMVFSFMVLVSLGGWAQTSSQKNDKSDKASTTTSAKAMKITGTVSSDGKSFVADKDNKSWTIDNPEAVKAHMGHHVSVNANEDAATDTLHVNSVKMVGKTKTETPSGTKY